MLQLDSYSLVALAQVNEELGNIYPLFNERPGSGNAIERVLALEIELAEALQAKKKSSMHFQRCVIAKICFSRPFLFPL